MGRHRFIPTEGECPKESLRRDWYQTIDTVVISIFVRDVNREQTLIDFSRGKVGKVAFVVALIIANLQGSSRCLSLSLTARRLRSRRPL